MHKLNPAPHQPDAPKEETVEQILDMMSSAIATNHITESGKGYAKRRSRDDAITRRTADQINALIEADRNKALKIERLKGLIKYNILKARYQRMYLGGEEDALPTKRYVKQLKKQLATLQSGQKEGKR